MNQNYSEQQLVKLCKRNEWKDYGLTKDELLVQLNLAFKKIIDGSFEFEIKRTKKFFLVGGLVQKLVLRKLNDNLKRIYKDHQSNRRMIVSQVKVLLEETTDPIVILKTDIKSFYESVDRSRLIQKLGDDTLLSYHTLSLLHKLFSNKEISLSPGLPRGMSISSTLSEIFMRKFDKWIRRHVGVYYYARFVDDIIIFANDRAVISSISENMNANLEEGLEKNVAKTSVFDGNDLKGIRPLEYLGYKFTTVKEMLRRKEVKKVIISIADKKVKKIKSRVIFACLDYIKSKDFILFQKRMRFLTGNFSVKRNPDGNDLKAGIFYNYSFVNDNSVFHQLNLFYQKMLFSKARSFGKRLSRVLSGAQRSALSKYSFRYGFVRKTYHPFTMQDMNKINECWS